MNEDELTDEMIEEMEDMKADDLEDSQEDSMLNQQEFNEAYGSPMPEEQQNAHSFLHKAAFESPDTLRTTFLNEYELGRPLFSMRFLLDLHDICKHYIDPICVKYSTNEVKLQNTLANYFYEKIKNICDSGMSNMGFAMNLNVTRKVDATKKRVKEPIPPINKKR